MTHRQISESFCSGRHACRFDPVAASRLQDVSPGRKALANAFQRHQGQMDVLRSKAMLRWVMQPAKPVA